MKNLKKFKGFTLVELIVVMAIFGIIMFAVIQLISPVSRQFSSTAEYEQARSSIDNVSRYINGTLRYANRVSINYCSDVYTEDIDSAVAKFAQPYFYANGDGYYDKDKSKEDIYVLMFDNSNKFGDTYNQNDVITNRNPISQYVYTPTTNWYSSINYDASTGNSTLKATTFTKSGLQYPINENLFEETTFRYYLGNYEYNDGVLNAISYNGNTTTTIDVSKMDASAISITLDIMKPKYDSTSGSTVYTCLQQCSTVSFSLINAVSSTGAPKAENIVQQKTDPTTTETYYVQRTEARFVNNIPTNTYDKDNDSFYIIYTLPEKY
jgi:prepilin-type N-terminal cleavage/methylation domain-containing protein